MKYTYHHQLAFLPTLAIAMLVSLQAFALEPLPKGIKVVGLEARPASIEIDGRFSYRQVLISGKLEGGDSLDLTRHATVTTTGDVVKVSADGQVSPVADGSGEVVYTFGDQSIRIPTKVTGYNEVRPISFVKDVQPVLSRMGCNQGTCHGAKDGKGGFKLSLRGYDAIYDHRALTDDIGSRRFNRAAPDQSLMLLKATGSVPHVGGVRTEVDSSYYELVRTWISQGVKLDLDAPRVTHIEVYPVNPIVPLEAMTQQITVKAFYTDGSTRDVTREAFIESGNIEVIEASPSGLLTTLRRGEAPVLVRYEGAYAATTIICMGDRTGFAWQSMPEYNYIDGLVDKKLQQMKILPSELCTDDEFVRRVYIDLTGLPPTSTQVTEFLADTRDSKTKREALVDQLVGSREYVEHWTNKWSDLLQVNRKFLGEEGSVALRNWIKESIATNKPYNQFAYEVLTASGSNVENPPAAYYKTLRDPASLMENTTHLFLAVRFNCNKCHDHPFERWTQDQYYQLSAYFAQVGRKEDPMYAGQKIGGSAVEGAAPLVEVIYDTGSGEVTHDRTQQVSPPSFPYQHGDLAKSAASRREELAHWITSKDNQYFAKSYVNRLWGYLFGVGIIEPIDDIRAGNPPTNPALLDAMAVDFIENKFDVQHMLRTICKSRTYQLSIRSNKWNEDDTINYSHAIPRRLPAEVLFDAIHQATGAKAKLNGVPVGFRAAQLPDAGVSDPFLDDFGKPVRESACECERSSGMVLGPVLKLINGPTVAEAIGDPVSELNKLVASETDDNKLIDEIFLRFLARKPTESERNLGIAALKGPADEVTTAKQKLADYEAGLSAKQAAWETAIGQPVVWQTLKPADMTSSHAATKFAAREDHSVLVSGDPGQETYMLKFPVDMSNFTGLKLEALADDSLPAKGPGRAQNGNFVLSELAVTVTPDSDPAKTIAVPLTAVMADFNQESWHVAGAVDNNPTSGWAVSPKFGENHYALFKAAPAEAIQGKCTITVTMTFNFQDQKHCLGAFRLSTTGSSTPLDAASLPADLAKLLAVPAAERTEEQKQQLVAIYKSRDADFVRLSSELQLAENQMKNARMIGVQDLAWALINNPAFLFNR
ncbi:protein of unknown function DUF1549 [Pirellula staleyi DSM 6068]|uniref:BIG2 domain-containing protein n=1 Tax=Pirellula staleyi (strain ATCC 27377 / DSM 6068 / ICPB 4128) TaxID=530564 RepID=D2R3U8_PIRSD|nr:DUF1549 and DUF1553 domain-containing protein [Pirellula staleyi]ADB17052.1 protein of unknown function DUF1549 [Pirellula staleyi DSM 6068]